MDIDTDIDETFTAELGNKSLDLVVVLVLARNCLQTNKNESHVHASRSTNWPSLQTVCRLSNVWHMRWITCKEGNKTCMYTVGLLL